MYVEQERVRAERETAFPNQWLNQIVTLSPIQQFVWKCSFVRFLSFSKYKHIMSTWKNVHNLVCNVSPRYVTLMSVMSYMHIVINICSVCLHSDRINVDFRSNSFEYCASGAIQWSYHHADSQALLHVSSRKPTESRGRKYSYISWIRLYVFLQAVCASCCQLSVCTLL